MFAHSISIALFCLLLALSDSDAKYAHCKYSYTTFNKASIALQLLAKYGPPVEQCSSCSDGTTECQVALDLSRMDSQRAGVFDKKYYQTLMEWEQRNNYPYMYTYGISLDCEMDDAAPYPGVTQFDQGCQSSPTQPPPPPTTSSSSGGGGGKWAQCTFSYSGNTAEVAFDMLSKHAPAMQKCGGCGDNSNNCRLGLDVSDSSSLQQNCFNFDYFKNVILPYEQQHSKVGLKIDNMKFSCEPDYTVQPTIKFFDQACGGSQWTTTTAEIVSNNWAHCDFDFSGSDAYEALAFLRLYSPPIKTCGDCSSASGKCQLAMNMDVVRNLSDYESLNAFEYMLRSSLPWQQQSNMFINVKPTLKLYCNEFSQDRFGIMRFPQPCDVFVTTPKGPQTTTRGPDDDCLYIAQQAPLQHAMAVYRHVQVSSADECARACVSDATCNSAAYRSSAEQGYEKGVKDTCMLIRTNLFLDCNNATRTRSFQGSAILSCIKGCRSQQKREAGHQLKALFQFHAERHGLEVDAAELDDKVERFSTTHDHILKLNSQSDGSVIFGHNPMSSMSDEEKRRMRGLKPPVHVVKAIHQRQLERQRREEPRVVSISEIKASLQRKGYPMQLDWRQRSGIVPPIRNQQGCATCYAFSSSDALAMGYAVKHNTPVVMLSPQFNSDCMEKMSTCDEGGWESNVYENLMRRGTGTPYEEMFPYMAEVHVCDKYCNAVYSNSIYPKVKSFERFEDIYYNETVIFEQLNKAPVSICFDAGGPGVSNYKSGILPPSVCPGSGVRGHYGCNHAVTLVGYDLTSNPPFYVLRNSWDIWFGMDGYMNIEAGQNTCGIAYHVIRPDVE